MTLEKRGVVQDEKEKTAEADYRKKMGVGADESQKLKPLVKNQKNQKKVR